MDAVLVCGFFIALALAAPRWGYDSRRYPRSREEELAAHGVSWRGRCAVDWDAAWWERAWRLSAAADAAQRAQLAAHRRRGSHQVPLP